MILFKLLSDITNRRLGGWVRLGRSGDPRTQRCTGRCAHGGNASNSASNRIPPNGGGGSSQKDSGPKCGTGRKFRGEAGEGVLC